MDEQTIHKDFGYFPAVCLMAGLEASKTKTLSDATLTVLSFGSVQAIKSIAI